MTELAVIVSWQILKGSQNFLLILSMALYDKQDVKNGFAYVLQLISDSLGGVTWHYCLYFFFPNIERTLMPFDIHMVFLLFLLISYYVSPWRHVPSKDRIRSRTSNIESNNSRNGGLEGYNNIFEGIFPHFTNPSIKISLGQKEFEDSFKF